MKKALSILFLVALSSISLWALDAKPAPAKWSLVSSTLSMNAGDTLILNVKVVLEEGWHTYGLKDYVNADGVGPSKTEFAIDDKNFRIIGSKIKSTKPLSVYDSAFEVQVEKFKHNAEFKIPITTARSLKEGKYSTNLVVMFQTCTAKNCLPPGDIKLPITISVKASKGGSKSELQVEPDSKPPTGTVSTEPPSGASTTQATQPNQGAQIQSANAASNDNANATSAAMPASKEDSMSQEAPKSFLALILFAMASGAGSWLMPCVYPMIPITVSFFTKRSEKEKSHPIVDALVYSGGIMSTYVIFGALIAILAGATAARDFASLPWVNFSLALLFLIIAGNLFGMYEIALPASLVNSLNRKSNQSKGYSSSFIMGMVFSLTAFTCTVPFVGFVGDLSRNGEWFRPLISMTFFGAVFALPFFLLALFPAALTKLPRSGAWMNNIKVVFGFVEIAFAISYFARSDSLSGWNIFSREVVLSIWAGCGLLITLYVLGVFRMKLDSHVDHIGGVRAVLATAFAALTFFIFDGIKSDSVGPLEPFVYVESFHKGSGTRDAVSTVANRTTSDAGGKSTSYNGEWLEDLNHGLKVAQELKRPVFVDFTGKSCTNCRWMEKNMFTKPEVQSLMSKMVLVRAFTDRRSVPQDKVYQQLEETRFKSTLLPLYVLLTPDDKYIASSTYTPELQEFLQFLGKASVNQTSSVETAAAN